MKNIIYTMLVGIVIGLMIGYPLFHNRCITETSRNGILKHYCQR